MQHFQHKILSLAILYLAFSINFIRAQNDQSIELAQQVLDKLYLVSGQYVFDKPALKISKENRRVASYSPKHNTITIDKKALEICMAMGQDASNALSFLIGHELAHAFQKEVRNQSEVTNFLAYDKHYHASERTEKVADIQGVFTGYLAGYGMKKAIPLFLKNIYAAYDIDDDKLVNYPSFDERSASAKEVIAIVDDLEDLFEVNEYLMALEQYDIGIYCLEYILEYYQGREIHNNLGIAYLHSAMDFAFDYETDKYTYPLELDASSQLKKIDKSRGKTTLNPNLRKIRNTILKQGLKYFENAIELDPEYTIAKINKACTLNLLNKPSQAQEFLKSNYFSNQERQEPIYKLVNAISLGLLNQRSKALLQFNTLRNGDDKLAAVQAEYNYNILKGIKNEGFSKKIHSFPETVLNISGKLKIENIDTDKKLKITDETDLFFSSYENKNKKSFSFNDGFRDYFSIIISSNTSDTPSLLNNPINFSEQFFHNLIVGKTGLFIYADDTSTIVKSNANGEILEIARYYKN